MSPKILMAMIAVVCSGSTAALADGSIEFDLGGPFFGSEITVLGEFSAGAENAGAEITGIEWSDLSLVTYDNVGVPYYGSEALIGISAVDADGADSAFWYFPFPDANYQGTEDNPIVQDETQSFNLEGYGLHLDASGGIAALLTASWDDTSGLPAGEWTSGTIKIFFNKIPAPGSLVLLGIAGLTGLGRRRRA
ncbi:MAG: PEP-CTERM sorting domain-containing protein [Phycisphaerales bacterium]|nr:hypothetical protein [Phycisphaerae bacterium]MCH2153282.1 PEP-CTERM sorting domain-containing protein [Phycisphaerales bacterium]